jgi:hypothetical protein
MLTDGSWFDISIEAIINSGVSGKVRIGTGGQQWRALRVIFVCCRASALTTVS